MFSRLIGIPYKLGGRDRSGMDCVAIVLAGLEILGAPTACPWSGIRSLCVTQRLPDPSHYPTGWRLLDVCDPRQAGDVMVLQQQGRMAHLALVISRALALTTTLKTGSYISKFANLPGLVKQRFRPPQFEGVAQ